MCGYRDPSRMSCRHDGRSNDCTLAYCRLRRTLAPCAKPLAVCADCLTVHDELILSAMREQPPNRDTRLRLPHGSRRRGLQSCDAAFIDSAVNANAQREAISISDASFGSRRRTPLHNRSRTMPELSRSRRTWPPTKLPSASLRHYICAYNATTVPNNAATTVTAISADAAHITTSQGIAARLAAYTALGSRSVATAEGEPPRRRLASSLFGRTPQLRPLVRAQRSYLVPTCIAVAIPIRIKLK